MKDISIVIVNYKMKEDIEKCLVSLYKDIEGLPLDIGVVVADNHSEDGIDDLLREKFPNVEVIIQETNPGFGTSQNAGMKRSEASYYFVLNPDTVFSSDSSIIARMHSFMEEYKKIGMIGPKIIYPDGSLQYSCWRFPKHLQPLYQRTKLGKTKRGKKRVDHHHMTAFDHNETRPVDAIMGSAMFARNEAVKDVGVFDERYWMYYEDIDWCLRMWEAGWPVYYVHDIVIIHAHGRGSAKVSGVFKAFIKNKLARVHIYSWLKFIWKWKGRVKLYTTKT
ncbi:MAG: glycosyltransferase family 2 protein [Candidatus Magasanikbacteria bacterium]